jgi:hypothetical protein
MNALNRGGSSQTQRDPDARQDRGQFDIPELESLVHTAPLDLRFHAIKARQPDRCHHVTLCPDALRAGG